MSKYFPPGAETNAQVGTLNPSPSGSEDKACAPGRSTEAFLHANIQSFNAGCSANPIEYRQALQILNPVGLLWYEATYKCLRWRRGSEDTPCTHIHSPRHRVCRIVSSFEVLDWWRHNRDGRVFGIWRRYRYDWGIMQSSCY